MSLRAPTEDVGEFDRRKRCWRIELISRVPSSLSLADTKLHQRSGRKPTSRLFFVRSDTPMIRTTVSLGESENVERRRSKRRELELELKLPFRFPLPLPFPRVRRRFRKLDPITSLEGEMRFLQAAESLFFKGESLFRSGERKKEGWMRTKLTFAFPPPRSDNRLAARIRSRDPGRYRCLESSHRWTPQVLWRLVQVRSDGQPLRATSSSSA